QPPTERTGTRSKRKTPGSPSRTHARRRLAGDSPWIWRGRREQPRQSQPCWRLPPIDFFSCQFSSCALRPLIIWIILQKSCQSLKVRALLDVAHDGGESLRVDEVVERHIAEVELAGDRNEDTIEAVLDDRTVGPHPELAAQNHIEGMGQGAARFIAEL